MTTHDALLAAVLAAPDDDLPRLVFADHLEENAGEVKCRTCDGKGCPLCGGDDAEWHWQCSECPSCEGAGTVSNGNAERAEFIRVQCELERIDPKRTVFYLPDPEEKPDLPPLHQREQDLWAAVVESSDVFDWFRGVFEHAFTSKAGVAQLSAGNGPDDYNPAGAQAIIRRGFVSEIRCTLVEWCGGRVPLSDGNGTWVPPGIGPTVVRSHPVTRVVPTGVEPLEGVSKLWIWSRGGGTGSRLHAIPAAVWDLLTDYEAGSSTITRFYATREIAFSALSAALILWAKSENERQKRRAEDKAGFERIWAAQNQLAATIT